jgi:uncharacterized protein DUF6790
MHTAFGEASARFIGWEDSPFQAEVGFASLGFAAVGFLAFRRGFDLRLAAVVGPAIFLLGAAGGRAPVPHGRRGQLRAGQRRRDLLHRHPDPADRLRAAVAAAPVRA